jgi:hypothetical protein
MKRDLALLQAACEAKSEVQIQSARAAKLAAVPTGESPVGGGAQMPP